MCGSAVGLFQMQPDKAGLSEAHSAIEQEVLGVGFFSAASSWEDRGAH